MTELANEQAEEASAATDEKTSAGVGMRFALGWSAAVLVGLTFALIALNAAGTAARSAPAADRPILVVANSKELLEVWDRQHVSGAAIVDVTRDLQFLDVQTWTPITHRPNEWPIRDVDVHKVFTEGTDRKTAMWVAARTGVARSIAYVLTPEDFSAKVGQGRALGLPGISQDGTLITANDDGYLRYVRDRFPSAVPAAAMLNIDASYFVNGSSEDLAARLAGSLDSYRMVSLNRAEDATDVPEAARVKLDRFADLLRAGGVK